MSEVNFGPVLCSAAEWDAINAAGAVIWAEMAKIIDASPHYTGADPAERAGHIVHMANQAIFSAAHENAGQNTPKAMLFGAARIIGNVLVQAPSPEQIEYGKRYVNFEINQGMADHIRVSEAKGSA